MIINRPKIKTGIPELLLTALSILFMIGIRAWFPVCEVTGENIMPCHWAGEMLKALSVLFLVLCILHIIIPGSEVKIGIDVSLAGLFILALNIPGNIIRICAHADMACRSLARPMTALFCILMTILAFLDIIFYLSLRSNEKHKRDRLSERS